MDQCRIENVEFYESITVNLESSADLLYFSYSRQLHDDEISQRKYRPRILLQICSTIVIVHADSMLFSLFNGCTLLSMKMCVIDYQNHFSS